MEFPLNRKTDLLSLSRHVSLTFRNPQVPEFIIHIQYYYYYKRGIVNEGNPYLILAAAVVVYYTCKILNSPTATTRLNFWWQPFVIPFTLGFVCVISPLSLLHTLSPWLTAFIPLYSNYSFYYLYYFWHRVALACLTMLLLFIFSFHLIS